MRVPQFLEVTSTNGTTEIGMSSTNLPISISCPGGDETDTDLFEYAVSKQTIMTSAEEDEVGQCPICDGLGAVYTYCRG